MEKERKRRPRPGPVLIASLFEPQAWEAAGRELDEAWVQIDNAPAELGLDTVRLRFEARESRAVVTGLYLEGELQARTLRALPIGALMDAAGYAFTALGNRPTLRTQPARRGKSHDGEFYERVAEAYRTAVRKRPRWPVTWLAEEGLVEMGMVKERQKRSVATVRRWLREAERRGLIDRRRGR
jgi:hypothetical protein